MAITNKVGPPVTGDDFYGRSEELSRAHRYLESNSEYNGHEPGARIILKKLCQAEKGLTRDQLFAVYIQYAGENPLKADEELSTVLNMLEHDGYIVRTVEGTRRFRSPLLRKWWHYKFVE